MKQIDKTAISTTEPQNTNVVWVDTSDMENIQIKYFVNGGWIASGKSQEEDSSNIFVAKYNETTNQELYDAYVAGKILLLKYDDAVYTANNISLFADEQIIADEETSSISFRHPLEFGIYKEINFDATKTEPDAPYIDEVWAGPTEKGFSILIEKEAPFFDPISSAEALKIEKALYYVNASIPYIRTTFAQAEATGAINEFLAQYYDEYSRKFQGTILSAFSQDYMVVDATEGGINTYGTNGAIFLYQVNNQYYLHFISI